MFMSPLLPLLTKIASLGLRTTGAHVSQEFCTHGWHYHHVYKPREAQPRLKQLENWKTLRVWEGGDRPPPVSFFFLSKAYGKRENLYHQASPKNGPLEEITGTTQDLLISILGKINEAHLILHSPLLFFPALPWMLLSSIWVIWEHYKPGGAVSNAKGDTTLQDKPNSGCNPDEALPLPF